MSGADGTLVYDFGGIESITASINTFVADMNANLSDLDTMFRDMKASGWSGDAAEEFDRCSRAWGKNADLLAATLQDLGKRLGTASVNMQAADQAAGAHFR